MAAPEVPLNNKRTMPAFGLGTWLAPPGEVANAVKLAIDVGYRHIDCALLYQNEKEIGRAIKEKIAEGVVKREDLFITSKLWNTYHRQDLVVKGCKKTLKNFGLDYIDLYLMHWPMAFKATDKADEESQELGNKTAIMTDPEFMPVDSEGKLIFSDDDFVDTYKELEKCVKLGLAKSIGVSNFNISQLQHLLPKTSIKPVTNQVEIHPYLIQNDLRTFCEKEGIVITGYCPLGSARDDLPFVKVLEHPTILDIAKAINKTPAQVVLRYLVEMNVVPIPKSTNPERMRQNISVFDFKLSQEQFAALQRLDRNERICIIPGSQSHKDSPF